MEYFLTEEEVTEQLERGEISSNEAAIRRAKLRGRGFSISGHEVTAKRGRDQKAAKSLDKDRAIKRRAEDLKSEGGEELRGEIREELIQEQLVKMNKLRSWQKKTPQARREAAEGRVKERAVTKRLDERVVAQSESEFGTMTKNDRVVRVEYEVKLKYAYAVSWSMHDEIVRHERGHRRPP